MLKLFYYVGRLKKVFLLWLLKVKNGKKLSLKSALYSYNLSIDTEIIIGDGCIIMDSISTAKNVHLSAPRGLLRIGKGCRFNRYDIIVAHSKIEIGEGTIFGPNVCVFDHDHSFDSKGVIKGKFRTSDVIIGKNVWIGAGTIILRGTNIGDDCVIGAGCVISGEIPARSLVTARNRDLVITALQESK